MRIVSKYDFVRAAVSDAHSLHSKKFAGHVAWHSTAFGAMEAEPQQREPEQAETEFVRWVSRIGPGGAVTGAMEVKQRDASLADDQSTSTAPTVQAAADAAAREPMSEDAAQEEDAPAQDAQPPRQSGRSALIADLPRSQIRLDDGTGSVNHVAAVVGGVAVNRYGQMIARVARPGEGEDEDPA